MITFIKRSQENMISTPRIINTEPYANNKTLADKYLPILNSSFSIEKEDLLNYLSHDDEIKNIDFYFLTDLLRVIDIKKLISESRVMNHTIDLDINTIKDDYDKYNIESRMRFPYSISIYFSNFIIGFIKNFSYIIHNLNYCAFVSDSKSEIDSLIEESKKIFSYELWLASNRFNQNNIEEMLHVIMTPFTVEKYFDYSSPNNPFKSKNDYIDCLMYPYKFMLGNLTGIKDIFNGEKNKLYSILLDGYTQLQKNVLTYRSKDIINLFLICMYVIHLIIEYNLLYSRELHEVAYFIYNEIQSHGINETEVYIPSSVHELFKLLKIDGDYNKKMSYEAAKQVNNMQNNMRLEDIDESYKRKFDQLQKTYIKIFKVGISKIFSKANSLFFKKYYGRIPHLYDNYGDVAIVAENKMVGDPVKILTTSAFKYVENLTQDATELFNTLLQMAKRITSTENVKEKINIIKSYCTKIKVDENNFDTIKNGILAETRYRIASSILQDNVIYGFTVEGIMQNKKFPPANHIVTSLFVKNPHEQPINQRVGDIFADAKSLLMFANPENIASFNNLYRQSASKIIATFNPKATSLIEKNINRAAQRYSAQLMNNNTPNLNNAEDKDPREHKKIVNTIHKSVIHAIDMVIEQKRRCLQCTGIAHDMISRVTDLAKRCIVSLLEAEKQATDPAYKTGLQQNRNALINRQNQANANYIKRQEEESNNKTRRKRKDSSNIRDTPYY
jgi:hypothetical protein